MDSRTVFNLHTVMWDNNSDTPLSLRVWNDYPCGSPRWGVLSLSRFRLFWGVRMLKTWRQGEDPWMGLPCKGRYTFVICDPISTVRTSITFVNLCWIYGHVSSRELICYRVGISPHNTSTFFLLRLKMFDRTSLKVLDDSPLSSF